MMDDCCKMATDAMENLEGVIMALMAQYTSKSCQYDHIQPCGHLTIGRDDKTLYTMSKTGMSRTENATKGCVSSLSPRALDAFLYSDNF